MKNGKKAIMAIMLGACLSLGTAGMQLIWNGSGIALASGDGNGQAVSAAYNDQISGSQDLGGSGYPGGCGGNCAGCAAGCFRPSLAGE